MAASEVGSEIVGDVVSVFGLYDFAGVKGLIGAGMRKLVLAGAEDWQVRSPVFSKLQVPLTMLHGTVDQMVPVEQAHRLRDAREAEGLPTTFHEYEGARHAFFNSERLAPSEEALGDVLDALRRAARSR
jgi:alpha-beta hydrolase superfamily lysophospholipase